MPATHSRRQQDKSSGLPPEKAPAIIAEKRKLSFSCLFSKLRGGYLENALYADMASY